MIRSQMLIDKIDELFALHFPLSKLITAGVGVYTDHSLYDLPNPYLGA